MWSVLKISNVFNQIALMHQAAFPDSGLKNYHYGWRSDIQLNRESNWNESNTKGTLFPSVSWVPPETYTLDTGGETASVVCSLFFDDLQGRSNNGTISTDTMLEQQYKLETIAIQFMREFIRLGQYFKKKTTANPEANGFWLLGNTFDLSFDSDIGSDVLVSVECKFTLQFKIICPMFAPDLPYTGLPSYMKFPPEAEDYEDSKNLTNTIGIIP